jgi:hypothetical protein
MIEVIFTLDYELYGNGTGSLRDLVYEPGERLLAVFGKHEARFVAFVEAAEFERIEQQGEDPAIGTVKRQIQAFHAQGFEVALHLHPQWYGARYEHGRWLLDYSEYNLCTLSRARISTIVGRAIDYLRGAVGDPHFTPLSFRAGNWLFQPTKTAASVLSQNGLRLDSSVFKGGVQHAHHLDYRPALRNGDYWTFEADANLPDPNGSWMEIPIYAEMVPFWKMLTSKRVSLQTKGASAGRNRRNRIARVRDYMRPKYPLKFDFCRMTLDELTTMVERRLRTDREQPNVLRPLVAIGHTKDLTDPSDIKTVDAFLSFLRENGVAVSTFTDVYSRLVTQMKGSAATRSDYSQPAALNA